jgi:hypothetical protein
MIKIFITTSMVFLFGIVNAQSSNSSNSNIAESSDCKDIVNAYELAVRKNITALRKIRNNGYVSNEEFENLQKDIDKWQNIVMKKCAYDPKYAFRVLNIMEQLRLGYNSTFPSIKENSVSNTINNSKSSSNSQSQSKSSSSSTSNKHSFIVTVTWNNPNCGNCAFPRPSAQNGIVDYFYERSGSYRVKPICPICGKTQNNTIAGFTDNIGTRDQGSKVVTISCNQY